MAVAIDFETHAELQRQLLQCEADGVRMSAENQRLRAALKNLEELGMNGMKPDYTEWLTFHDTVAKIAGAALSHEQELKPEK